MARSAGMNVKQRLTTSISGAAPWQQLTPDQEAFRASAQGRWAASPEVGTKASANVVTWDPASGCCDISPAEPDGDEYIDLGGKGGVDFKAGKP